MEIKELRERQGWSLAQKIDHSLGVIDQFYSRLGGKDSTIVLWLARKIYSGIKAVFCNTGNEIIIFINSHWTQNHNQYEQEKNTSI